MNLLSMRLFWFYIRVTVLLIVLTSILAAILVSVDLSSLIKFNELFHIL